MGGNQGLEHEPGELPAELRALIELVFERMDAATGPWRLELEAVDGRLRRWFRHEGPHGPGGLGRFDV